MMAREAGSCPKCGKPYYEDTRKDNERIYTCECNKGERTEVLYLAFKVMSDHEWYGMSCYLPALLEREEEHK